MAHRSYSGNGSSLLAFIAAPGISANGLYFEQLLRL
jgi:hypothetical protein